MEQLHFYEIHCSYDNSSVEHPVEDELIDIVLATPSEMQELEEKASYAKAPYGYEYATYTCKKVETLRYCRDKYEDELSVHNASNHCRTCSHFVNGNCEIYYNDEVADASYVACDRWERK